MSVEEPVGTAVSSGSCKPDVQKVYISGRLMPIYFSSSSCKQAVSVETQIQPLSSSSCKQAVSVKTHVNVLVKQLLQTGSVNGRTGGDRHFRWDWQARWAQEITYTRHDILGGTLSGYSRALVLCRVSHMVCCHSSTADTVSLLRSVRCVHVQATTLLSGRCVQLVHAQTMQALLQSLCSVRDQLSGRTCISVVLADARNKSALGCTCEEACLLRCRRPPQKQSHCHSVD